ncbi:MAG: Uroporphyrin-III C/tetrapyrrole (Corrin/Porphyrin) methyltransferase [Candidatus Doudnabacteria bacterium]|nr:Uroporphyrin-III C/tetrapyrrole (Corrin/Porphyrin) methyltransferase [Candidatus Doudnabacteria bacterium]
MLYILSSPIGNLSDLSDRAKQTLTDINLIIAENPLYSKKLTDHLGVSGKKFVQFAEHNELRSLPMLLELLQKEDAVLISDAGTPGISDPGFKLIREAIKLNIPVTPIPGPNAAITALCASGLPTDKFIFLGFVPKTEIKFSNEIQSAVDLEATIIFYESPHRINKTIGYLATTWPDAKVVVARELTKMHEEFIRGSALEVAEKLNSRQSIKGEITVVISFK